MKSKELSERWQLSELDVLKISVVWISSIANGEHSRIS